MLHSKYYEELVEFCSIFLHDLNSDTEYKSEISSINEFELQNSAFKSKAVNTIQA